MRAALYETGKYIGKPTKDSIRYTLQGIGLTLLLALAWPLLMLSIGLQLNDTISPSDIHQGCRTGTNPCIRGAIHSPFFCHFVWKKRCRGQALQMAAGDSFLFTA